MHLWIKKLNLDIFLFTSPKQKSPLDCYHYPPGRENLIIPSGHVFPKILYPREKGAKKTMKAIEF